LSVEGGLYSSKLISWAEIIPAQMQSRIKRGSAFFMSVLTEFNRKWIWNFLKRKKRNPDGNDGISISYRVVPP
jgi:hypothetical protein